MTTAATLTTKQAKQAKWEALPPALIQRPLSYIKMMTTAVDRVDGKMVVKVSPRYERAKFMAATGNGSYVAQEARKVRAEIEAGRVV